MTISSLIPPFLYINNILPHKHPSRIHPIPPLTIIPMGPFLGGIWGNSSPRKIILMRKKPHLTEHNSYDNDPWILTLVAFTEKLLAQSRIRIIGVCFGHQILGRALGAPVGRSDAGWEISVMPVQLTTLGKQLFRQESLVRVFQLIALPLLSPTTRILHFWNDLCLFSNNESDVHSLFTRCTATSCFPTRRAWRPSVAAPAV